MVCGLCAGCVRGGDGRGQSVGGVQQRWKTKTRGVEPCDPLISTMSKLTWGVVVPAPRLRLR